MVRPHRLAASVAIAVSVSCTASISGCGSSEDDWSAPRADLAPVGTLGPGFIDPESPPPPEGAFTPRVGSWDEVHPPVGYRVVLLTAGDDGPTTAVVEAAERWAEQEGVSLKTVAVDDPDEHVDGIVEALDLRPDLILSASAAMTPALDLVTASNLHQPFLVVGAQLSEPTVNVTSVIWAGASAHDGAIPAAGSALDPAAFTPERADTAIRAGVASVLSDITGVVVNLA